MQETQETWARSSGQEMAAHSSMLAWEIPQTEEIGRLQSLGSQESDMTEQLALSLSVYLEGETGSAMKQSEGGREERKGRTAGSS